MLKYIGTKILKAGPMTLGAYNIYRGWPLPSNENPDNEGYLVEYQDGGEPNDDRHEGYISWSPKNVFESAYCKSGGMSFGHAIELAKLGFKVARTGWNGAGMFAYIVPANSYPAQTEAIKGTFENDMVPYREYWALKTAQNDIAMWSPSGSDSLANDWCIVD